MKKVVKFVAALFAGVIIAAGVKTEAKADATPQQIWAYYEMVNPGSMAAMYGSQAAYESQIAAAYEAKILQEQYERQQIARAYQALALQDKYETQLKTIVYQMNQMADSAAEAEKWRKITHGTVNPYADNYLKLSQQYQQLYAQYEAAMRNFFLQ